MTKILAISTGSTSTKIALYCQNEPVLNTTVRHSAEEIVRDLKPARQRDIRQEAIEATLASNGFGFADLDILMSAGGTLKPMPGGVYRVNAKMADDILHKRVYMEHASNLGALVCFGVEQQTRVPGYIADPVTTDEFAPVARITGLKGLCRQSQAHALNAKAVARLIAEGMGKSLADSLLVVAHMGGGSSVSAIRGGRIIDALTSRQDGPFSSEAAGALPMPDFVDHISDNSSFLPQSKDLWFGKGGLASLTGTTDITLLEERVAEGDEWAKTALEAFAYTHAKAIGSMTAALGEFPDAIILTGGAAYSELITKDLKERVGFLAPVCVVEGEDEMNALFFAAGRVLSGEENVLEYE